jgi:Concanavalin A-like lectin/glucanases superfamily
MFNLVKIENPFEVSKKDIETLPIVLGLTVDDVVNRASLGRNVIVIRNGNLCDDLRQPVFPNDIIHVIPKIGNDSVRTIATIALIVAVSYYAPGAGAALAGTGASAGSVAAWSGVFSFATLTAGGMLINSLMPPAASGSGLSFNSGVEESPTYGWNIDRNPAQEGLAIPVIYGYVRSLPQLINFYLEIDSGGDQWVHMLLSIAEGLTNNVPTADDIYVGDELLSSIEESDYELYATDGSNSPDTGQLIKFDKLHQFRPLKKNLTADHTANLLHFNGADASTTIVDESVFDGTWECQGTADLSTAHPWGGTANLDLTNAATDYLKYYQSEGYKNWDIFVVDIWDIELRFRQSALQNAGICGQHLDLSAMTGYNYNMYWSIVYDNAGGNLIFQQFKEASGVYTVYFNITGTVSLSVDTWHHLRVARSGNTVYLFLDGTLVGSGAYSTQPEEHGFTGYWYQGIGRAYWYTTGPEAHTLTYAQAEIDEFQFKTNALIYDTLASFTPATGEAPSPELGVYGVTKGSVDELTFIIEASYGLYWVSAADGSLGTLGVYFDIMYRLQGTSTWTTQSVSVSGKTRNPVKEQFSITMPTRGIYEFRVVRKTPDYTGSSWQARTWWTGLDEILDEFLSYPGLQLVSVSLMAQDEYNTTVPPIRVVNNRSSITVPTFNGASIMTVGPTNNGYAAYDMLTNDLYGGGVDPSRFEETDWQAWIDWCNGSVDGNPRCQFNMIMDAQYSMDEALQHVENTGRAKIVMRGTKISVAIEKPASASYLFSSGNIIQGSSKLAILPRSDRSDAVEISFKDKDNNFNDNKAFFPSAGYEALNRVPKIVRLTLPGINNYEQALREAIFRQQLSENIKRSMNLETGIEGIPVTVSDVVRFAQDVFGGRLAADSAGGQIRIDQTIILDSATYSGNCKMWIKTTDDTILEGTVSGPFDEETNILSTSVSSAVSRFDNYMIGLADNTKYIYRLVSVTRSGQKRVAVTGLQYVESSFYHANYGAGTVAI